jgi:hypothetical protein
MRRILVLAALMSALVVALMLPSAGQATNCGRIAGKKIVTYGGLSCKRAGTVWRAYKKGNALPRGWTCGLSSGSCYRGRKGFYFRFTNR